MLEVLKEVEEDLIDRQSSFLEEGDLSSKKKKRRTPEPEVRTPVTKLARAFSKKDDKEMGLLAEA
jgi:hypothetical protein